MCTYIVRITKKKREKKTKEIYYRKDILGLRAFPTLLSKYLFFQNAALH